jgi:hypothetical protein
VRFAHSRQGAAFGEPETWQTWLATLKAAFGIELNRDERRAFESIAGSRKPPEKRVQELWTIAGRVSGKSRIAAAIATYIACFMQHDLDPGETGYVLALAGSRDQAQMVFNYAVAFVRRSPILRQMIKNITAFEIKLNNNATIAVHSNSFRLIRGRTLLSVIFDEVAFWRDDTSATPDIETYRAVRPSLARTGGMLIGISSPYRRGGLLHQKFSDHYGVDDAEVLVVRGGTALFNPTIAPATIAKEMAADPESARSEWLAEFRTDISTLFDDARAYLRSYGLGRNARLARHCRGSSSSALSSDWSDEQTAARSHSPTARMCFAPHHDCPTHCG